MSASPAQQGLPSALWTAACKADEAAVRKLLRRRGTDLEAGRGTKLGTALCAVAHLGHSSIVNLLLRAGANANAQCSDGSTPLHQAATSGHAAVARRLIAAGADINARKDRGTTPLLCAMNSGALEIVQMLVNAGADVRSTADNDVTVLHMAASRSSEPGLIPYLLGGWVRLPPQLQFQRLWCAIHATRVGVYSQEYDCCEAPFGGGC